MNPNEYFDRLESCIDEIIETLENVTDLGLKIVI